MAMNVLLVGSGGREHAIAWKLAQSPLLAKLYIAPGNAGTGQYGENVPVGVEEIGALTEFACSHEIGLAVVGPEVPLALGLADELRAKGIRVFGPSKAAAEIESSKVFAKDFMARHQIPTAAYASFNSFNAALAYLENLQTPVVIKASGLAAGKGVLLPETKEEAEQALREIMVQGALGPAGQQVVIEERLSGEEVSLLAFSDGKTLVRMPSAQDHKRLLDGDQGPNTGGMGAYAPAPVCPAGLAEEWTRSILAPVIQGMAAEGRPFVGVLFAGFILTTSGPKILEFNCRFGDPETQAILPLLETDLLEIMLACADGCLDQIEVRWKQAASACIVLAAGGYPGRVQTGLPIQGLDQSLEQGLIFHAGTRLKGGQVQTAGGRVLGVTAWGADLRAALKKGYQIAERIHFEGVQYRKDIGAKGLKWMDGSAYSKAGVNIDAGNRAVEMMKQAVKSTYTPAVLGGIGAFGGSWDASILKEMQTPVLVASTDGVGTKVKLAAQTRHYASAGQDIVNHCIDDILVQGARPLLFLDYFATSKLDPLVVAEIVSGMAQACREAGCVLIGGETAEMPGVYEPGEFDVAGTILGVVEKANMLPRNDIQDGDLLVGLRSSGPHTNGYSLIRQVFAETPLDTVYPELGRPLDAVLLEPHRSYLNLVWPLLSLPNSPVKALAHITGGGFIENIPRALPQNMGALVLRGSWPVPPLYKIIQNLGQIPEVEMARVFNQGIGMVMVVAASEVKRVQAALGEESWVIGRVVRGEHKVVLQ